MKIEDRSNTEEPRTAAMQEVIDGFRPSSVSGHIHVCPLSAVADVVARHNASHLLTCLHDDSLLVTPPCVAPANHLRLVLHDIAEPLPDCTPPNAEHIASILGFAHRWDRRGSMVVHCWAGISRSPAAAYILLCAINPRASEAALARRLRQASPTAYPNRLMIRLADAALARGGRMIEAVESIGRGVIAGEAAPFVLPALHASEP
jgi:predicted protein tyrosine phosphatase